MITVSYPVCGFLLLVAAVVVYVLVRLYRTRKSKTVIIGETEKPEPCPNCGCAERVNLYGEIKCKECRYPFEEQ